jgi:Transposase
MRRYTETERRRIVRAFAASGMSATAFCRRRGVSTVTLAQWRKRLEQAPDPTASVPPSRSWLPVVISDGGSPQPLPGTACYRLVCGDWRLEVPAGFDLNEVRALWQLLAGGTAEPLS